MTLRGPFSRSTFLPVSALGPSDAPLVADLESWLGKQRAKLSRGNDLAKAMDYMPTPPSERYAA